MDQRIGRYQQVRRNFAKKVYLVSAIWLLIAIAQWIAVNLLTDIGKVFKDSPWISVIFFLIAIGFCMLFIFVEQVRFTSCINWLVAIVTIEFAIIGLFALAVQPEWPDMLMWFIISLLILYLFILIGTVIPHDLTLDVVVIFVISFIFLITSIFLIMLYVLVKAVYAVILYQIVVTVIIVLFVMYHAQTISGGRFAEMRVNDFLLATLILFFDFIIIYLLTFYVQTKYPVAKNQFTTTTASTPAAAEPAAAAEPEPAPGF